MVFGGVMARREIGHVIIGKKMKVEIRTKREVSSKSLVAIIKNLLPKDHTAANMRGTRNLVRKKHKLCKIVKKDSKGSS